MTTTNTTTDVEWESHAARLADELAAAGKLTDLRLAEAVRAVPRHALVPTYHQQTADGSWAQRASVDDLAAVYANTALITALAPTATGGTTVLSSSTQPGLMTRLIEALRPTDGARVLEVGTGTGYNAGILAHRLGEEQVYSVDVEADLVELARQRHGGLGYHPTLVAGDGAAGLPEHAPFDAIIATCAVPTVPWAWIEQVRPGGVILTDLKPAPGAGSLVRLTRTAEDRAEGRLDATYAAFMDLRHEAGHNPAGFRIERDHDQAEYRTTSLDRTPPGPRCWSGSSHPSTSAPRSPTATPSPRGAGFPPTATPRRPRPGSPPRTAPGPRSPPPPRTDNMRSRKATPAASGIWSNRHTAPGPPSTSPAGTPSGSPSHPIRTPSASTSPMASAPGSSSPADRAGVGAVEKWPTLAFVVPPAGEHEPPPEPNVDDAASDARDELRAAMSGMRATFDDLERTWNTGIRETLSRLDDIRQRTDQLDTGQERRVRQAVSSPPRSRCRALQPGRARRRRRARRGWTAPGLLEADRSGKDGRRGEQQVSDGVERACRDDGA